MLKYKCDGVRDRVNKLAERFSRVFRQSPGDKTARSPGGSGEVSFACFWEDHVRENEEQVQRAQPSKQGWWHGRNITNSPVPSGIQVLGNVLGWVWGRSASGRASPHSTSSGAWGNCPGSLGGQAPDASGGPLSLRGAWEEPESWTELSSNLPAPTEDSTGLGVTRLSLHLDHQGSEGSVEGCQDGQRTWVGPGGLFCTKQATGP